LQLFFSSLATSAQFTGEAVENNAPIAELQEKISQQPISLPTVNPTPPPQTTSPQQNLLSL